MTTQTPSNLLPHNPLNAAGVLEELKKLKGEKSWVQFELEILCAQYPDNTVFTEALAKVRPQEAVPVAEATTKKKNKAAKKGEQNDKP